MSILEQLKHIDNFSDAEQHIIHYLLGDPENIINLSIKDLAKLSNTSTSTVTRLVNKLNNNKGYSHFKALFFSELSTIILSKDKAASSSADATTTALNEISALQTQAIDKTRCSIDHATVSRVFSLLSKSEKIEFYGFDDNLHMVKYHLSRLMSFGKQVIIHDSTNSQFFQAYGSGKSNAAIIVSRTGKNKRLLEIMEILKIRETNTIVLTPDKASPLAKDAAEWIQVEDGLTAGLVGNITFDTSLQYILNVLFILFHSEYYENYKDLFETYGSLWMGKL